MRKKNDYENEYERALFFKKQNRSVHITRKDKSFLNGKLLVVKPNYFILYDEVLGEVIVFFDEITRIEPRINKEDKNENT